METLFGTIAQVSFTIVGLFFVALTVDSETRDFWFSQKTRSRYVYFNLLVMLLPGFLSLARLATPKDDMPIVLPFLAFILFFLFLSFSREMKKMKKEASYAEIADVEGVLDLHAEIRVSTGVLLFITIWGTAVLFTQNDVFSATLDHLFSGYLVLFSIVSILPVNVFLRIYSENKLEKKKVKSAKINNDVNLKASDGERNLIRLLVVMGAFLIGLFLKKE